MRDGGDHWVDGGHEGLYGLWWMFDGGHWDGGGHWDDGGREGLCGLWWMIDGGHWDDGGHEGWWRP